MNKRTIRETGAVAPALHFLAEDARLSKRELAELRALLDEEKTS